MEGLKLSPVGGGRGGREPYLNLILTGRGGTDKA